MTVKVYNDVGELIRVSPLSDAAPVDQHRDWDGGDLNITAANFYIRYDYTIDGGVL